MRAEISKSTKENKEFVRNVERGKMLDGIQSKAAAKQRKVSNDEDASEKPTSEGQEETTKGRKRTFAQVPLAKKRRFDEGQPEEVHRVLSKIF
jgi:ESF2/ABP1 family protein